MDTATALAATEHSPSVTFEDGMVLDCGARLQRMTVAYRTYGTLNAGRSNAVLICHALTGDQYVAERHPSTGKDGWWDMVVGPGLPVDTDRYFEPVGLHAFAMALLAQDAVDRPGPRPRRHRDGTDPSQRRLGGHAASSRPRWRWRPWPARRTRMG